MAIVPVQTIPQLAIIFGLTICRNDRASFRKTISAAGLFHAGLFTRFANRSSNEHRECCNVVIKTKQKCVEQEKERERGRNEEDNNSYETRANLIRHNNGYRNKKKEMFSSTA